MKWMFFDVCSYVWLYNIHHTYINSYSFDCGSNATVTENSGGMFVTAGPVTLTP